MCVCCACVRAGECSGVLEQIHLLWQVEGEQAAEAAKTGLSSEVEPHDLA